MNPAPPVMMNLGLDAVVVFLSFDKYICMRASVSDKHGVLGG